MMQLLICGIDEAGRGPLAGPVAAAAVILPAYGEHKFLNDSKKMSAAQREHARSLICSGALAWGIGWATHTEIDTINILQASLLAMKRAFEQMCKSEALKKNLWVNEGQRFKIEVIVDGLYIPDLGAFTPAPAGDRIQWSDTACRALVKADAQIPEVMAASILAKTARDSYMDKMAVQYPQYGYDRHKGYPTKAHREAIIKYGPSPIQRRSFSVKP